MTVSRTLRESENNKGLFGYVSTRNNFPDKRRYSARDVTCEHDNPFQCLGLTYSSSQVEL